MAACDAATGADGALTAHPHMPGLSSAFATSSMSELDSSPSRAGAPAGIAAGIGGIGGSAAGGGNGGYGIGAATGPPALAATTGAPALAATTGPPALAALFRMSLLRARSVRL